MEFCWIWEKGCTNPDVISDTAAWVQAIGSILAIFFSILIASQQGKKQLVIAREQTQLQIEAMKETTNMQIAEANRQVTIQLDESRRQNQKALNNIIHVNEINRLEVAIGRLTVISATLNWLIISSAETIKFNDDTRNKNEDKIHEIRRFRHKFIKVLDQISSVPLHELRVEKVIVDLYVLITSFGIARELFDEEIDNEISSFSIDEIRGYHLGLQNNLIKVHNLIDVIKAEIQRLKNL